MAWGAIFGWRQERGPRALGPHDLTYLGPLLTMTAAVERRFETDTRAERLALVGVAIPVGMLFNSVHNVINCLLLRDAIAIGISLRLFFDVVGLVVWRMLPSISGHLRELIFFIAMVGVCGTPIFLIWHSNDPNAFYTLPEYFFALVYAAFVLQFRFHYMLPLTMVTVCEFCFVCLTKPGLPLGTQEGLVLDMVMGAVFTLFGSYHLELSRRRAYLRGLQEIVRSEELEADKTALTNLSSLDSLTGLANRRTFDAALETALRTGQDGVALLIIDIDHFKAFNDTVGHVAGDRCLREVAAALSPPSRIERSLVARIGGEEFAVLLPGLGEAAALHVAEAARAAVEALALHHAGRPDGMDVVTVSVGVAAAVAGDATALLEQADAGLYEAKRLGRNRCALRNQTGEWPRRKEIAA